MSGIRCQVILAISMSEHGPDITYRFGEAVYSDRLQCLEPIGHYPSQHRVKLPMGEFSWDNNGYLSYSRCPVEDPSTHEFPCVDYYSHCVHCRTMLNGKECDLEHVAESKRVSRSSSNKSKRLV